MAASSPLALLSVVAVLLAGAAFLVTERSTDRQPVRAAAPPTASPPRPDVESPSARPSQRRVVKHVVRRGETYVEVFNNSGVSGLAGSTAARAAGAGWQVVGTDNWYGTIAASTVYYPRRLREEAELLRKDLGVARIKPLMAPMRGDRLTVILTADQV